MSAPFAVLERSYILEYLKGRGYTPEMLDELPQSQAQALMRQASLYASGRLEEIQARDREVHKLRGEE
jgi:hypothetical protein